MYPLRYLVTAVAALAGVLAGASSSQASERVPVLLELFTSEGCSSCPPADRLLESLDQKQPIGGAELIVMSEHVDYWNRLGWKDPFSSAEYSGRQQEYTEKYRMDGIYTPQVIVDGRWSVVGSDAGQISTAVKKAASEAKIPITISNVARSGTQITARITLPAAEPSRRNKKGILYVALADNWATSDVKKGENAGHALKHVSVTRTLRKVRLIDLHAPSANDISLAIAGDAGISIQGGSASGTRLIAFVQDPENGRILAVAGLKL